MTTTHGLRIPEDQLIRLCQITGLSAEVLASEAADINRKAQDLPVGPGPGRWYTREGIRITAGECALLCLDDQYRHVADTYLGASLRVSTEWLGIDYSWGQGPIRIFNSYVFQDGHRDPAAPMVLYSTEAEAKAGHHGLVRGIRGGDA